MEHPFPTPADLVADESFRRFVGKTDPVAVLHWTNWLARHPDRAPDVEEATRLVRLLGAYQPTYLPAEAVEREIGRLQNRLANPTESGQAVPDVPAEMPLRIGWRGKFLRYVAAASMVLTLGGGLAYTYLNDSPTPTAAVNTTSPAVWADAVDDAQPDSPLTAQTNYGQRRTVRLPDGSVVTLNAHSTLTLSPKWATGNREVTLRGEAFFRVSKQQRAGQAVKFTVRAGNVAVEVLGTQFDVSTRNRRVKVVLNEGRIRLNVLANSGETTPARSLMMLPGDLIEVTDQQAVTLNSRVATAEHVAWVSNELVFDDTPLSEVARVIEENYGYAVEFTDPALASQRLTATLPDASLPVLLKALEKAFSLSITTQQKTIRLAKAN